MPLPVPNLDDRNFDQLVTEGRSLIPRYSSRWTNHNPSDPGITLMELFAYLTDTAMFQLNQVTDASLEQFLRLMNVCRKPTESVDEAIARALTEYRRVSRAVIPSDFVTLAREAAEQLGAQVKSLTSGATTVLAHPLTRGSEATQLIVKSGLHFQSGETIQLGIGLERIELQVRSISGNVLFIDPFTPEQDYPAARALARTTYTTQQTEAIVVIVPEPASPDISEPSPDEELKKAILAKLREHLLITTRLRIEGPVYIPVDVNATVVRRPASGLTNSDLQKLIQDFLHPLRGGLDHRGWPFGRAVYYSEMYQLLEDVPEVDHVSELRLLTDPATEAPEPGIVVPALALANARQISVTVLN